ncbi:MAG: cytochrome-c peroxidase [Myxococcales bacterium 68-20]|nr:cytochrome-c peroxidase [Myxococcales bacterium]OJY24526.1 MAG: cytochrome-c peroxidase [Myxococcales bacterium 68-20]
MIRHHALVSLSALVIAASLAALGCEEKKATPASNPAPKEATPAPKPALTVDRALLNAYAPLPEKMLPPSGALSDDAIALGKQLWFDARLSKNQDISCNTCHGLDTYGVDNKPLSPGHKGQLGARNSPTVYNAATNSLQFWDGRAKDVEEQALGPILNPVEMAMKDEAAVLAVIRSMPEYVASFKKAFPNDKDPVTFANVGNAIGAFERTLVTPSRFDKYLGGDDNALTEEERAGLAKFLDVGCNTCHTGAGVGGRDFKKLGQAKAWPTEIKDNGRFDATKDAADKHFFKVSALRNVEKTAPYFHDGSVKTLEEAVKLMATHQLGKDLSDADVASIVTFLKSLTGELPKIDKPELPKSTAKTPKADAT